MIIDYLHLRRLIGYVAFFLPWLLIITNKIFAPGPLPGSMSDYYYANATSQTILVGSLCLISGFLWTYHGYTTDSIPVKIMSLSALGVALCPTIPVNPSRFNDIIGIFHGTFAALTFLTMAYTCLFLFTRSHFYLCSGKRKVYRNRIYRICGITMCVALLLIPVTLHFKLVDQIHPMFWLETILIETFSVAWMVKGQFILREKL